MATTFNYETSEIKRDFHFAKFNEPCRLTELPCRVGSPWCHQCKYNAGVIHNWQLPGNDSFVMCSHPDMPDSPDSEDAEKLFFDYLLAQAFSIL